ncbi:hypothetical protein [Kozakia baliensis]|uniref:hypothetical protein n=1 Tax=Kozakia baliensis TaxID=153496 RepID=UPI000497A093|nr:hypothetical protein [Kozakia baliensis]
MNCINMTTESMAARDEDQSINPMLSMVLPACNIAELKAAADSERVIWRRDKHVNPDYSHLQTFLVFLYGLPTHSRDFEFAPTLWCSSGPAPSKDVVELLAAWSWMVHPLRIASMYFAVLIELQGDALSRAIPVFMTPALQLFRQTIAEKKELKIVDAWLQRCDWRALLRGARSHDLAVWAVMAGRARVEGCGVDAVIRLYEVADT